MLLKTDWIQLQAIIDEANLVGGRAVLVVGVGEHVPHDLVHLSVISAVLLLHSPAATGPEQ